MKYPLLLAAIMITSLSLYTNAGSLGELSISKTTVKSSKLPTLDNAVIEKKRIVKTSEVDVETKKSNFNTKNAVFDQAPAPQKGLKESEKIGALEELADAESALAKAKRDLELAKTDLANEKNCKLTGNFDFCSITYEEKRNILADVQASPTLEEGAAVKVGVFRGIIELGEDLNIPISVLYADVSDTPADSDATANALKLADPEQGLNLTVDYGGYWSLLGVCRGETSARCFAGITGGVRYLELTESSDDLKQYTFGGMVTAKINMAFNIFSLNDRNNKAGTIGLFGSYSAFYHDGTDSDQFFSGIVDANGQPVEFDESFSSLNLGASIHITKVVKFKYAYFRPNSGSGIDAEETISISFDAMEF